MSRPEAEEAEEADEAEKAEEEEEEASAEEEEEKKEERKSRMMMMTDEDDEDDEEEESFPMAWQRISARNLKSSDDGQAGGGRGRRRGSADPVRVEIGHAVVAVEVAGHIIQYEFGTTPFRDLLIPRFWTDLDR
jgi:hypothetical protein